MSLSRSFARTAIAGATAALTALGLSPLASANSFDRTYHPFPGETISISYKDATGTFCVKADSKDTAEDFSVSLTPKPPKGATASSAFAYKVKPNTGWNCDDKIKYADEDTLYNYVVERSSSQYYGTFYS